MLLITGITGHSGKYFLKELEKNHYAEEIKVIVRNQEHVEFFRGSPLNIKVVVGDLNNQSFLDSEMINVDTVFHIASIFYSENVVKVAVSNKVKRIILVHTTEIGRAHV